MTQGKTLIAKAAEVCGSEAELARRIGTSRQALSSMKHGTREISPETAALLADVAKLDPHQAIIDAVIERNKTGEKAAKLREILGKALVAGVAIPLVFSYGEPLTGAMEAIAADLTILHIVLSGAIAEALRRSQVEARTPHKRHRLKMR